MGAFIAYEAYAEEEKEHVESCIVTGRTNVVRWMFVTGIPTHSPFTGASIQRLGSNIAERKRRKSRNAAVPG
jgi:hypothetical protein